MYCRENTSCCLHGGPPHHISYTRKRYNQLQTGMVAPGDRFAGCFFYFLAQPVKKWLQKYWYRNEPDIKNYTSNFVHKFFLIEQYQEISGANVVVRVAYYWQQVPGLYSQFFTELYFPCGGYC